MDNGWVNTHSSVNSKLHRKGYSLGGYIDNGMARYVLYRIDDGKFERVHEFNTKKELNNMLKLLIDEGD